MAIRSKRSTTSASVFPASHNFRVFMTPKSAARLLWTYGEDGLWPRALELTLHDMAALAPVFGGVNSRADLVERYLPDAPVKSRLLRLLPLIEFLEGAPRAPARFRGRPARQMPAELLYPPGEDGWTDPELLELARLSDALRRG